MLEKNVHYLKNLFPGTNFRPKAIFEILFGITPFTERNEKATAIGKKSRNINIGITKYDVI